MTSDWILSHLFYVIHQY